MTAKDVLLLLRHSYQSPAVISKFKFRTYFDDHTLVRNVSFFYSISEFTDDNSFHPKDKKSDTETLTCSLALGQ